ncbi:helix-turn-helix domain-containing protein [Actinosynnema mirum]|uniref:helix-turn-helix domain-containing protein n=1 Tax=Actinosynnema mirum TaxID=40567 RepID=UPI00019ABCBA|nr:helix-turn-helix transcriptional regulator [Actinosynnema mirum]
MPALPPELWESREVHAAVASDAPGVLVAIARRAHGLRQDELGALAGYSQSAISRLESGSGIAYDLRVLRTMQRLLGIPAHLLGLADRAARPSVSPRSDRPVDPAALTALRAATARRGGPVRQLLVLRRILDDAHHRQGWRALVPATRSLFDFADALRRAADGDHRRRLLAVAATYAEFSGLLYEEVGDRSGAVEWTTRALEQGQAADDPDVVAHSYVRLAQLAEPDGERVLTLTRAALRERGIGPRTLALVLRQQARGLAMAGDETCMARLDHARELLVAVARDPEPDNGEYRIGYRLSEQHVELERAACWLELGQPHRAIAGYEALRRRRWGHARAAERGLHTARLAAAHAAAGHRDQAVACGYEALDAARDSGSGLVLVELGRLGPWVGERDVRELARWLG